MTHVHTVLALVAPQLAIDPTGAHLSDTVTKAAANLFLAMLAIRGAISVWRRRLLEVVVLGALAACAATFIYFPSFFHDLGQALVGVLSGTAG